MSTGRGSDSVDEETDEEDVRSTDPGCGLFGLETADCDVDHC